jgi:hypothetical protein
MDDVQNNFYFLFIVAFTSPISKTRAVSHCGLATYIKNNLKAKEIFYGNSNISPWKSTILKKSSKRNQNPSRYYNTITNLKFQHKLKYYLSEILI